MVVLVAAVVVATGGRAETAVRWGLVCVAAMAGPVQVAVVAVGRQPVRRYSSTLGR